MSRHLVAGGNALVLGTLLGLLLLIGGVTWEQLGAARTARAWAQHTNEVIATIKDLDIAIRDAETGQRGYLLTGDNDYLVPYETALGKLAFLQNELQRLTSDDRSEQERLRSLAPVLGHKLDELAQTVQLRRESGFEAAVRLVQSDAGRQYMKQIEASLAAMTTHERTLLAERFAELNGRGFWLGWLLVGGATLAVLTLLWAAWLLNQAWSRSNKAEIHERSLALRLQTSLDSLSQGVAVFGSDLRLTDWNECFQTLLSLPKALVRAGTPYSAFVAQTAADNVPLLEPEDEIRHSDHEPGMPTLYERSRADGGQLELRRTSMRDSGFVLTVTDMTKRAQAENILREAQRMQAIGQLTGGIAHDFNNLLTVILGNLEVIDSMVPNSTSLKGRVERTAWAAQRAATLTSQLLAFARKQPLDPAPIDLATIVPKLLPMLQSMLGEEIDLRYIEPSQLWRAMADPTQLENALINLAVNSRDAMPDGGRLTIELADKVLDEEYARTNVEVTAGAYLMLAVSDTGHGMPPDVAAKAFEPFFTTKPEGKGTGLGLSMVYGFVKQSAGHVKIYSEPGHGTTVRLYLPKATEAEISHAEQIETFVEVPRGSATVLVIEDEAAVREIASTALRGCGYNVLEAADGEEALRVFNAHTGRVDLLLSDVVLPGKVRARDMVEQITSVRPDVRVLYMSGYSENAIIHHGRLDDGVELISKPFKREQLAHRVAQVLGLAKTSGKPADA
jgi:signal transduction histidine kinase/CHASE3 domain sensor protein/CheY-like chemotaxis protein